MDMIGKVRRMKWRDQLSDGEICSRTGLARNTVKKWLKAPGDIPPKYERKKADGKLTPFVAVLEQALRTDAHRAKNARRSGKALFAQIQAQGYRGGYSAVTDFIRAWRVDSAKDPAKAFVPLSFELGEAFQFDWSEEGLLVGGVFYKLQVAHLKLCASRAFWLVAYPGQGHEMLFDAHTRSFHALGGVARRGIYDNMKTAVDKVREGKRRDVNARFTAMVSHYLFAADFCNPASGWEKGQIEKNVQDSRRRVWNAVPQHFKCLDELNTWLEQRCKRLWQELRHPEQRRRTIAEVLQDELPTLMPVPVPFDGFIEQTKRVTPTCLVHVERNRYSVPASFAGRTVSVRLYPGRVVFVAEGQQIAEHVRCINRSHDAGRTLYDWRHYLSVVQRKPGALRNGAPFLELPDGFRTLQQQLLQRAGGDKEMVEILALVLRHDEQAVLTAVELALESGAANKQHILNLLSRLLGQAPPAPVDAPPALALQVEPVADMARYDHLRRTRHAS